MFDILEGGFLRKLLWGIGTSGILGGMRSDNILRRLFLRTVKVTSSSGTVHEYVRVVTSVREDGKICQKVIANLGRRDTLQAILPQLQRLLQGERDDDADRQLTRQLGLAE
jgi:hypothetical protein